MVAFFGLYVLQGVEPTKKSVHYKRKASGRTPVSVANECPCGRAKRSQILPPQPIKSRLSDFVKAFFFTLCCTGASNFHTKILPIKEIIGALKSMILLRNLKMLKNGYSLTFSLELPKIL